ncbi:hypothetical protein DPMN_186400 [Dreissena polymorpha]|uniref:Uncharacterized protein n=1 Tax=Dreissena polymorpha TaxID=45954 RepID=A0A9D4I858_DREPO|nr:hypothetical protein DPMN_186400 [Dreissena polymorpha]
MATAMPRQVICEHRDQRNRSLGCPVRIKDRRGRVAAALTVVHETRLVPALVTLEHPRTQVFARPVRRRSAGLQLTHGDRKTTRQCADKSNSMRWITRLVRR